jgi:hypothetical protein
MATTDNQFFPTAVTADQTLSGAGTIRKLEETAPASNTATTVTWTTTTVTLKTVIPVTANSASGDTSQNNGWVFNNGGADGLGSISTAKRVIPSGVWAFSVDATLNSPALLATIACTITARVYRVATGGGARTLLFSVTSANFSATGVRTWNSASQGEIVLEVGEVLMVGYTATSASTTATVLGANTNTVLTFELGANTHVTVPTPGVRTRYLKALSAVMIGLVALRKYIRMAAKTATMIGAAVLNRHSTLHRSLTATAIGVASVSRRAALKRALAATMVGVVPNVVRKIRLPRSVTLVGVSSLRKKVFLRRIATMIGVAAVRKTVGIRRLATMVGASTLARALVLRRTLSATMNGIAKAWAKLPFNKIPSAEGGTVINVIKKIIQVVDD